MALSVIVPAHQAAEHLPRCLAAIAASTTRPREVIVVDDGSTDGTAAVAAASGARVVPMAAGPVGPAAARNAGAATATGDVLVFLDADVAVHPDTLSRFADCLAEHPEVAAVFGSYDDSPHHQHFVSQYRNLLHHFVHQQGRREAFSFWAGCGAIRRAVFLDSGGFDERYRRASIEDIELGGRLSASGHRVWLRPDIQAGHLKRWTFRQMVRCDVVDRAIPWTRLILRKRQLPSDLNTSMQSRLSALAAWTVVVCLPIAVARPAALAVAAVAAGTIGGLNAPLYGFFRRRRGLRFALGAAALHGLYLLYSSAAFGIVVASSLPGRARAGSCPRPSPRQTP